MNRGVVQHGGSEESGQRCGLWPSGHSGSCHRRPADGGRTVFYQPPPFSGIGHHQLGEQAVLNSSGTFSGQPCPHTIHRCIGNAQQGAHDSPAELANQDCTVHCICEEQTRLMPEGLAEVNGWKIVSPRRDRGGPRQAFGRVFRGAS
jgi:hypothetical protein